VPADLSVAGFDGQEIAALVTPALTTVRFPAREIGERAAEALIARLERRRHPRHVALDIELVARASTGPAPAAG
jgi:DNA-binding LacI/PurR family transcriptional regulator